MSLIPLDSSNQISLYSDNKMGWISNPMVPSFSPKTECPIDPRNDLLPPGFTSPFIDMKMGPPEQTIKRYFSLTVDDIESFHKEKIKKYLPYVAVGIVAIVGGYFLLKKKKVVVNK